MIRLPFTSISLSDKDVEFHLQQVDIYTGLLRQGFKRKEILRYFDEHRRANQQNQSDNEIDNLANTDQEYRAPTCVELALRPRPELKDEVLERHDNAIKIRQLEDTNDNVKEKTYQEDFTDQQGSIEECGSPQGSPGIITYEYQQACSTLEDSFDEDNLSISPVQSDPLISRAARRHAPRKSSLLRFAETVSPGKMSSESDVILATPKISTQLILARSNRSHTDPYHDADVEISTRHLGTKLGKLDIANQKHSEQSTRVLQSVSSTSMLRPEAETFVPLNLPSTFNTNDLSSTTPESEDSGESSPESVIHGLPRRDTILNLASDHQNEFPSSPPDFNISSSSSSCDSISLPPLPDPTATPTAHHQLPSLKRTDPRTLQHLYHEDRPFSVYNETQPANSQPQTPADLGRRPPLTEREAAYTAPPGALRNNTRPELMTLQEVGRGEQSPTVRAMGIRERRNRELLRSVRLYRRGANRWREWNPEGTRRGLDGNDEDVLENNRRARGAVDPEQELLDTWRDELEVDRVGEENFDTEIVVRRETGMRVVSGNARRDL